MPLDRFDAAIRELKSMFGDALQTGVSLREIHGRDEGDCDATPPDCVLFAESCQDISSAISVCASYRMPIIAFGAGSGQEGGVTAPFGGLSIDTSRLNRIVAINIDDQDCWVESGVTRLQLDDALRGSGLLFPVDPGADASIGGMAATGAAGTTTPRYGSMHQNVLGLEVVMADGTIVTMGNRARKSSAGYDLTHLFVGSEGTLGVITKVCLRLHPHPEAALAVQASFPDVDAAVHAVVTILASGVPLSRAEMMDARVIKGLRLAGLTTRPEQPLLLLEVQGSAASIADTIETMTEACSEQGAVLVEVARKTEEMSRLWALRHATSDAEKRLRPGARVMVTDVAVPVSSLPDIVAAADEKVADANLCVALSGHVADGNVHYAILLDPSDAAECDRAHAFKQWLAEYAVSLGGTISGEHGIGVGKRELMKMAHGPALDVMRKIKDALDPLNLLNPGKVLPSRNCDVLHQTLPH